MAADTAIIVPPPCLRAYSLRKTAKQGNDGFRPVSTLLRSFHAPESIHHLSIHLYRSILKIFGRGVTVCLSTQTCLILYCHI